MNLPIVPTSILYRTPLYAPLAAMAARQRIVLFAGLPGVGKSLFLQQAALLAHEAGRAVHLLQWDVTRAAFETPALLARYPEIDGITHAAIRKGVGLWARDAIYRWHDAHPDDKQILIGEVPLIGNRLIELVQPLDDAAEALLAGAQTTFVLPVPTRKVRQAIEIARAQSTANPQHEREVADAMPHVLQLLWAELYVVARRLGIATATEENAAARSYDPELYAAVYGRLLQHRHVETLWIDQVLPKVGSVYELPLPLEELQATAAEVTAIMARLTAQYDERALEGAAAAWYEVGNVTSQ